MALQLYNTLRRKKEIFRPKNPKQVSMYVCGPTVYNYAHIGNARPAVVFDLLFRLLRLYYPKVIYARNITDIDDKILAKSEEEGCTIKEIAARYCEIYRKDMEALQVLPPTFEPRAAEHIPEILHLVKKLMEGGFAYEAQGHVLFHTPAFADYGCLSKRNKEDMIAGARVETAPYKKDPFDFVLWKPSAETQPGWDSPWGRGRPGWHIECSAMIHAHFGEAVDIHGGGQDLIFPHHENEIAQSACAHKGEPCAHVWLHNGFVNINQEKMSKSLDNVFLVHDLLKKTSGESLRLALLSVHYRSPLNWDSQSLIQANSVLDRFYESLIKESAGSDKDSDLDKEEMPENGRTKLDELDVLPDAFLEGLQDDLNISPALAVMHELAAQANSAKSKKKQKQFQAQLLACGNVLGVLQHSPQSWFQAKKTGGDISAAEIESLIAERNEARRGRDFKTADTIRSKLQKKGILLKDNPEGTSWQRQHLL